MLKFAIPLFHVSSIAAAEEFYCGRLGFRREFAHQVNESQSDPCYMGISRDGTWVHLSSFAGDGVAGGVVTLVVDDVEALHKEFVGRGVPIAVEPVNQTWGTREMYIKDGDGNCLRFQQLKASN